VKITKNEPLARWTTLGVGGEAALFTVVTVPDEMESAIRYVHQHDIPYFILGKGSNTLFSDQGYSGMVILNRIQAFVQKGPEFSVGSGYSFSLLGIKTARLGYTGLEFASGIPGSVGGAVVMNAGANSQETSDVLTSVEVLTKDGDRVQCSDLAFGYRTSPFQGTREIILSALFTLTPSNESRVTQLSLLKHRKATQPLKEKSAGCMFRNPPGKSAGRLIEEADCKNLKVGGAQISNIHANFMINRGGACASDVQELIEQIKARVYAKTNILLEEEIVAVPR